MGIKEKVLQWQKTRDPKLFDEIYRELKPLIGKNVSRFMGGGLPTEALELEARRLVAEALERYQPTSGEVHSFVSMYLKGLSRFTNKYQAALRLPENYNLEYTTFDNAFHELQERLGREPSAVELADALGWPIEKVKTFLRRRVSSENFELAPPAVFGSESLQVSEARAYLASKYGREAEKLFAMVKGLDGKKYSLAEACRILNMPYYSARNLYLKMEQEFNEFLSPVKTPSKTPGVF